MRFVDFPFPSHLPSFIGHKDVLHYLQSYAEHFDLNQCIQFNTEVEEVTPVVRGQLEKGVLNESVNGDSELLFQDTVKWRVMAKNLMSGEVTCKEYDGVIVCNGHYSEGYIPTIPGIHHFSDDAVHSHCYRDPEDYTNQRVLVVGFGPSGTDIVLDLSPCCSQVYISNRGPPIAAPLPSNVTQVPGVICFKDGKLVEFTDGTVVQVDTVMFATGYNYTFPFLNKECGVMVDSGSRIRPLYKHTFNCLHPSMAFVGIQLRINPFPLFDYQVQWIKAVWSGENSLPSEKDLFREDEEFYHENLQKGLSHRKAGHFYSGDMQWKFLEEIGSEPLDPVYQAIYEAVSKERRANLIGYKKINYKVTSKSNFEVL